MEARRLKSLFVFNGLLRWRGGHPYTETAGWIRLAREKGVDLKVFANARAAPDLLAELGASPLLEVTEEDIGRYLTQAQRAAGHGADLASLTDFMIVTHMVKRACAAALASAREPPEAVVFAWSHPALMNGVAEWLADLPPTTRPKVVFNVGNVPQWRSDPERRRLEGDFVFLRFATRRLRALCPPENLLFTATDGRFAEALTQLTEGPCAQTPLHHAYPTPDEFAGFKQAAGHASGTISVMGALRDDKGLALVADVVGAVARAGRGTRFRIQAVDAAGADAIGRELHAKADGARVEVAAGPLSTEDYFKRIFSSDLLLLPYRPEDYAMRPSGVLADAIVCGVPTVVPKMTWAGDRMAEGWSAGEMFSRAESDDVAAAILRALDRLPALQARAAGQAPAWRKIHSLEAYWDRVLAALSLTTAPILAKPPP